jgi:hypothetical protein
VQGYKAAKGVAYHYRLLNPYRIEKCADELSGEGW